MARESITQNSHETLHQGLWVGKRTKERGNSPLQQGQNNGDADIPASDLKLETPSTAEIQTGSFAKTHTSIIIMHGPSHPSFNTHTFNFILVAENTKIKNTQQLG